MKAGDSATLYSIYEVQGVEKKSRIRYFRRECARTQSQSNCYYSEKSKSNLRRRPKVSTLFFIVARPMFGARLWSVGVDCVVLGCVGLCWVVLCCVVLCWVVLCWVGLGWVGLGWVGLGWVGLG